MPRQVLTSDRCSSRNFATCIIAVMLPQVFDLVNDGASASSLSDSGDRSGFMMNLSLESVARIVWAFMLPTVCSVTSRQILFSCSLLQLVTGVIAARVAPDRPRSKMLHSFRVLLRRLVRLVSSDSSSEAVHSELSALKLHVGLITSGQFALVEALVRSIWRRRNCQGWGRQRVQKGPLTRMRPTSANVYTSSGDR